MTTKPHDALFKAIFSRPESARQLLWDHLSDRLRQAIDWSTLTLESGSHVDASLDEAHTDLLFSADYHISEGDPARARALFYIIVEHQSTNDRWMALRAARYVLDVLEQHHSLTPDRPLPMVFVLVVSHAPGGWRAPVTLHDLYEPHPTTTDLPESALNLGYAVEDLAHLTNEQLRGRALDAVAKIALAVQRDARSDEALLRHPDDWADLWRAVLQAPNGMTAIGVVLQYLSLRLDEQTFERFRVNMSARIGAEQEAIMNETLSWAESHIEKGKQLGRAEGRAEGRVEGERQLLRRMLELKFGPLTAAQQQRLDAADHAELDGYSARLLDAATAADVFDATDERASSR